MLQRDYVAGSNPAIGTSQPDSYKFLHEPIRKKADIAKVVCSTAQNSHKAAKLVGLYICGTVGNSLPAAPQVIRVIVRVILRPRGGMADAGNFKLR